MTKKTLWFDPHVIPVRVGVYEKDFEIGIPEYQYWDGKRWHYGDPTPDQTVARYLRDGNRYFTQPKPRPWRGLASPTKDPA
jgi:hypothetical protein